MCQDLIYNEKESYMKKLIIFPLSIFLLISVTGCSVGRFTQTRMMEGVKKINKTDLKLDFQLDYNPTARSLSIKLAHQPYSIYKPKISLIDLGLGLAAVGIWGAVFYDNWDHDYTFDFTDDTFDWYGMDWWDRAVLIGVPTDILLYWTFAYPIDRKKIKLQKQPLTNHPYRIELPDHGNLGINYNTTTGDEEKVINEFIAELGNPQYLNGINSLRFRVSTEVSGKYYKWHYTAPVTTGTILPIHNSNIKDINIDAKWQKNPISAGERAELKITVQNNGKTDLIDLTVKTTSIDPNFNGFDLEFGSIQMGKSKSIIIGFHTDSDITPQDIIVSLSFMFSNGNIFQETSAKLSINN